MYISIPNIEFKCPHCNKKYYDNKDIFLNRCNKNKCGYTKIKCDCGNKFGMTYNYKGEAVGFKLIQNKL